MSLARTVTNVPMICVKAIPLAITVILVSLAACEDHTTGPRIRPAGEPYVVIERPPAAPGMPRYSKVVRFEWRSGSGSPPDSVRYLINEIVDTNGVYNPGFDIVADLNEHPRRYDGWWLPAVPFDAPGDSGTTTIVGDDETLASGRYYIFAVRAVGRSGAVTINFSTDRNVRLFRARSSPGPLLTVTEPLLGGFRFVGTAQNPVSRDVPSGTPLNFRWRADAGSYAGEVAGYRYGWDVPDPGGWNAPYREDETGALEASFHAGAHTLTVEAIDLGGAVTRASIIVESAAFPMARNLLWIDDFPGGAAQSTLYEMPSESNHDSLWLALCGRTAGFEPALDVYDCRERGGQPPGIDMIGRYKNVIWTYSASSEAWRETVYFTPESEIGQGREQINILPVFLIKGGHTWTLGRADRNGGLAAVLAPAARSFPLQFACEITGNREDCEGDRSGVQSMPYRDFCITILDKIDGVIRRSPDMPFRSIGHYDVMMYAYRDDGDYVTARHAALPARLDLRTEVTAPGRYFDPDSTDGLGGLAYAEVLDPAYWMSRNNVPHQICFHPIYRMRARDPSSVLDHGTVAVWITRYEETVPEPASGIAVAAPSVHFAFPLWFFEPASVDSIASVVFEEWGILDD